ncbi:MAG: ECF transporter S component [Christensenellaceae bacterium]
MKANTRKITSLAMLAAISIVLVLLIRIPMFLPFLEYDPADIPIFIATFAFGPLAGFLLTVVVSVLQGLTVSAAAGPIGIVMHIFATGLFVLVAGNLYKHNKTKKGALLALICGVLIMTAAMVVWNMILTPLYMSMPVEQILPMLLPAIVPFNLIKGGINAAITFLLYKSIGNLMKGNKKTLTKPTKNV